jgi:hypothetical protein
MLTTYTGNARSCIARFLKSVDMEENKIESVEAKKIYDILECTRTKFYNEYYNRLKPFSFFDVRWKNRRLYPLKKVMEIRAELDAKKNYTIVK